MERVETLKVGLKIAVSTRSAGTENRIFKRGATKNKCLFRVAHGFFSTAGLKDAFYDPLVE